MRWEYVGQHFVVIVCSIFNYILYLFGFTMKHTFLVTNHSVVRSCSFFVALLFCCTSMAYAMQVNILLQGKILADRGGAPIVARYVIESASGKKLRGTSTADGSFKQVLQSGENYTVTFTAYNILKTTTEFSIPVTDKYREEPKDFVVPVLQKGENLLSIAAFQQGQTVLTAEARTELEKIAAMLKDNRGLSIAITVGTDAVAKTTEKSKKQSKKKKGKAKEGNAMPADNASALVQARVAAVNDALQQIDAAALKRVTIVQATAPPATGVNLVAVIDDVKDLFK